MGSFNNHFTVDLPLSLPGVSEWAVS